MVGNWGNLHVTRENYDRFVMFGTGEVLTGVQVCDLARRTGRDVEVTDRTPEGRPNWLVTAA